MATNSSEHLGLHLWEPGDQVLRTEFNQNWSKIDEAVETAQSTANTAESKADAAQTAAAVAGDLDDLEASVTEQLGDVEDALDGVMANLGAAGKNARIAWGSYTGTNAYGAGSPNSLTCDFIPQVVFILGHSIGGSGNNVSAFLLRGAGWVESIYQGGRAITINWTSNGVSWYCPDDQFGQLNYGGNQYTYLILGYDDTTEA